MQMDSSEVLLSHLSLVRLVRLARKDRQVRLERLARKDRQVRLERLGLLGLRVPRAIQVMPGRLEKKVIREIPVRVCWLATVETRRRALAL
jgi:hypothetical protein